MCFNCEVTTCCDFECFPAGIQQAATPVKSANFQAPNINTPALQHISTL
jgi:hypothetical protein